VRPGAAPRRSTDSPNCSPRSMPPQARLPSSVAPHRSSTARSSWIQSGTWNEKMDYC
jgi:hypothetical protein